MHLPILSFALPLAALSLTTAAPMAAPQTELQPRDASTPITLTAVRGASPVQYQSIQASGNRFWIGKAPTTFCPSEAVNCASYTNYTTIISPAAASVPVAASLYDAVPGGQVLYVSPYGEFGFSAAGPMQEIPPNSFLSGFEYVPPANGQAIGDFGFTAGGATGFVACPTTDGGFPYKIWANVAGANLPNCIGIDVVTQAWTGARAWEYV